jgi:NitT/TauT family transport system substrate-binding protein
MIIPRLVVIFALLVMTTASSAEDRIKFPAAVGTKTIGQNMLWVGTKQGFFEEEGLEVQPILLRGSSITVQALVGESIYAASSSADVTIGASEGGANLVIVAGAVNGLTQAIVAGKNYRSFKDLRGATLGVQSLNSGATNVLIHVLKENGLEYPADYKILGVGGGSYNLAALSSGKIAATYLVVPLSFVAVEMGFNTLGYFRDYFPNYQLSVVAVNRGWAEKNRPLLVRFLTGLARTHRWLYENKEAAVAFLAKEFQLKPEYARRGWEYYTGHRIWHPRAEVNIEGLKTTLQLYAEHSQLRQALSNPLKYVDQSYLKEALNRLGGEK